jgi:uncharacterized protein (TIGR02453 family)
MAGFNGFGPKALPFFKGLAFHQDKTWFEENRGLYESDVMAPFAALIEDLTAAFAKARVPLKGDGRKSIFRIHRDVRFSKDKSPYKTHAGAVMTRSGAKNDQGLIYIHISPDGCFTAAGFHMPEPAELASLRQAIKTRPTAFKATLAALKKSGLELSTYDQLSRVPRGFEELKGSAFEELIKFKSFLVEEKLSDQTIRTPELVDTLVDFTRRAMPLLKFGWQALEAEPLSAP